jgi:hypothetical protein
MSVLPMYAGLQVSAVTTQFFEVSNCVLLGGAGVTVLFEEVSVLSFLHAVASRNNAVTSNPVTFTDKWICLIMA